MGAESCVIVAPSVFALDLKQLGLFRKGSQPLGIKDVTDRTVGTETIVLPAKSCPFKAIYVKYAETGEELAGDPVVAPEDFLLNQGKLNSPHSNVSTAGIKMEDHRVGPKSSATVSELSVENRTGNSIIPRFDAQRRHLQVIDCCLEEQGK